MSVVGQRLNDVIRIDSNFDIPATDLIPGQLYADTSGNLYIATSSTTYTTVGSGSTPWDPTTPATPKAWWKADVGVYKDTGTTLAGNGDSVRQWNDQSGNGWHLGQATAGNRPTLITNYINSLPVVRFDGVDDCLTVASFDLTSITFAAVYRASTNLSLIYEQSAIVNSNDGAMMYVGGVYVRKASNFEGRDAPTGNYGSQNDWHVWIHQYLDGTHANHKLQADGAWLDLTTAAGVVDVGISSITDTLNIGARNNGASLPLTGDIAEMIVYSPAISYQHCNKLSAYLANRWNVAGCTV